MKDMKINSFNKNHLENVFIILFIIITFSLLLYRISIHADIYDEIINLSVSYRVALGQIPFYEIWDSFQSGDILLAPFLYVFIKIVGSSGGIVFFSRLLYVSILVLVSLLFYSVTNKYMSKKLAFLLSYIFIFFQLYGLFYFWYDTIAIVLMISGCLFSFKGLNEKKFNSLYMILSGLCHGLMAFAYPTFVFLAIFFALLLFLYTVITKKTIKYFILYIFGGSLVLIVFTLYVIFVIGIDNFKTGLEIILSYRSISSDRVGNVFLDIISSFIVVNKSVVISSIILIFIFFVTFYKNIKYVFLFSIVMLLAAFFNIFLIDKDMRGLGNFMAFIALWAPFFFLLKKRQRNDKYNLTILLFLWLPSIMSSMCVAMSTVYADQGPIKSWQGFILAGIVTVWIMIDCLNKTNFRYSNLLSKFILCTISSMMLFNSYLYIYLNQPTIVDSNIRVRGGIYKFIKVNSTMEGFQSLQDTVLFYTQNKKTILAGNRLRPIYLMTDLLPCVPTTEGPCYYKNDKWNWDMSIKYFEIHDKYPDIMFLEPNEVEGEEIKELIEEKYNLIGQKYFGEFSVLVYEYK